MVKHGELTQLLIDWGNGNRSALDKLMPVVYGELRRLADNYMRRERTDHTLQATALVNEAYIRLVDCENISWKNRAHFFGVAAQLMRNILVDHARKRGAVVHGGDLQKITLDCAIKDSEDRNVSQIELTALDDALTSLAVVDPRQVRIIELRYFGGLTIEETAEVLCISPTTVKDEWKFAKAWLLRKIGNPG